MNQNLIANTIFRHLYASHRILFNKMLISSEKWKIRWDDSFKILDLNSLVFKRRWRCENAWARHIWSTHSSFRVHVNKACVSWPWPHFHGLLTSFNIHQVLQLGHDSLYKSWRVHFYQVCVSWPWPHFQSTDFNFRDLVSFSIAIQHRFTFNGPHIFDRGYISVVTFVLFLELSLFDGLQMITSDCLEFRQKNTYINILRWGFFSKKAKNVEALCYWYSDQVQIIAILKKYCLGEKGGII